MHVLNVRKRHALDKLIAPFSDVPMFYIKYLTMYKVHMHAGAIRKLLFGFVFVRMIIHSLKLVGYLLLHMHKPYVNLHMYMYLVG